MGGVPLIGPLLSPPKPPSIPEPPPIPTEVDPSVTQARKRRRRQAAQSQATTLTGSQGIVETGNTAKKTLLGT